MMWILDGVEERYSYDRRNRLVSYERDGAASRFEYDAAGNLLRDDRASYTYDAFNRQEKAETFDGNIQINRYDAEGLRHEMEENGRLVQFIFRDKEAVMEESEAGTVRYIRTHELLASDAEHARTYYHYASDEMGSITHVTGGEEVLNRYGYDAWGNITEKEEAVENRFCFAGEQYDPVSQQYYLRARFYNPVIGRFTQEDTYRGDGLNLYAYCQNNPVYYVDPSGHSLICAALASKIIDQINARTAGKDEVKKLSAYLREKVSGGKEKGGGEKLSPKEQSMARKLGIDVSDIKLGEYGDMKSDKSAVGQAHHLNQAAAFKNIPYDAGISLKLEGNAFKDIGSPHYNAHSYMEQFWNQYRIRGNKYGQTPTVAEHNTALYDSLLYANLDKKDAAFSVRNAFEQQKEYGYNNRSFVRRIPGHIGQKK